MSEWKKFEDQYWIRETREMFPFVFRINKSKHGYGYHAIVEIASYTYDSGDEKAIQKTKNYFDYFIKNTENQEKRIKDLEQKLEEMRNLIVPASDYQI
jgi:hypothetical protein